MLQPSDQQPAERRASQWNQADEPKHVGQHARGDEQRTGHEDDHAVDQFLAGQAALLKALVEPTPNRKPFPPCQKATGESCSNDETNRGPGADPLADLK
jgi:hypothetical protein